MGLETGDQENMEGKGSERRKDMKQQANEMCKLVEVDEKINISQIINKKKKKI